MIPDINIKPELLKWTTNQISQVLTQTDCEVFKHKSPSEITKHAYDLANIKQPIENSKIVGITFTVISLMLFRYIFN